MERKKNKKAGRKAKNRGESSPTSSPPSSPTSSPRSRGAGSKDKADGIPTSSPRRKGGKHVPKISRKSVNESERAETVSGFDSDNRAPWQDVEQFSSTGHVAENASPADAGDEVAEASEEDAEVDEDGADVRSTEPLDQGCDLQSVEPLATMEEGSESAFPTEVHEPSAEMCRTSHQLRHDETVAVAEETSVVDDQTNEGTTISIESTNRAAKQLSAQLKVKLDSSSVLLSTSYIHRHALSPVLMKAPTSLRCSVTVASAETLTQNKVYDSIDLETVHTVCETGGSKVFSDSALSLRESSKISSAHEPEEEIPGPLNLSSSRQVPRSITVESPVMDPCQVDTEALEKRRPALISGLHLPPYFEHDPNFKNLEVLISEDWHNSEHTQIRRTRTYYRRVVERFPKNYTALVNLACCQALLGLNSKALPLLTRAIRQDPERASAHVNQVLCLLQLRDIEGAYAAIENTFISIGKGADLSQEQRSLLLRIKSALFLHSFQVDSLTLGGYSGGDAVSACCQAAAAAAIEDPLESPIEARLYSPREADRVVAPQMFEELRDGLFALKYDEPVDALSKPPWGRRHAFSSDTDDSAKADVMGHGWRPLHPYQLSELRTILQGYLPGDPSGDRGKNAYKATRSLMFLSRLEPHQAMGLLNLAEFVDVPQGEAIFYQGQPADYMYMIASGAVRIEAFQPQYGIHPVTLDTYYDGQSFGERAAVINKDEEQDSMRRATAWAQEDVALIRFLPMDYRHVIGADDEESDATAQATFVSPSVLECRLKGLRNVAFLDQCSEHHLVLLAQNAANQLELRFGDEVVQMGGRLDYCYIILQGFCKCCVAVDEKKAQQDWLSTGKGVEKLPPAAEETLPAQPQGSAIAAVRCSSRLGANLPQSACSEDLQAKAMPQPRPPRTALGRRAGGKRPCRSRTFAFRSESSSFSCGPAPKEVNLAYLSRGQAFGLGTLYEMTKGECPYPAGVTVRVDSDEAKVLLLTGQTLMFLPDAVQAMVIQKCSDAIDPAQSSKEIRNERRRHREWVDLKQTLLREVMTKVD